MVLEGFGCSGELFKGLSGALELKWSLPTAKPRFTTFWSFGVPSVCFFTFSSSFLLIVLFLSFLRVLVPIYGSFVSLGDCPAHDVFGDSQKPLPKPSESFHAFLLFYFRFDEWPRYPRFPIISRSWYKNCVFGATPCSLFGSARKTS